MEELINLKINNMPISVKKGTKILQAAQMFHIDIPHYAITLTNASKHVVVYVL